MLTKTLHYVDPEITQYDICVGDKIDVQDLVSHGAPILTRGMLFVLRAWFSYRPYSAAHVVDEVVGFAEIKTTPETRNRAIRRIQITWDRHVLSNDMQVLLARIVIDGMGNESRTWPGSKLEQEQRIADAIGGSSYPGIKTGPGDVEMASGPAPKDAKIKINGHVLKGLTLVDSAPFDGSLQAAGAAGGLTQEQVESIAQRASQQGATSEPIPYAMRGLSPPSANPDPTCECGADTVRSPIHSSWCPKDEKRS